MAEANASTPAHEIDEDEAAPVENVKQAQVAGIDKAPWVLQDNTSGYSHSLDEICEFLVSSPSLEQITHFQASAQAQAYLHSLLAKARGNTLGYEEREALDHMMQLEHFVRRLKIWALRKREET